MTSKIALFPTVSIKVRSSPEISLSHPPLQSLLCSISEHFLLSLSLSTKVIYTLTEILYIHTRGGSLFARFDILCTDDTNLQLIYIRLQACR